MGSLYALIKRFSQDVYKGFQRDNQMIIKFF